MRMFQGGGGRSNPNFQYKIRAKKQDGMLEWCDQYPVTGEGNFERYYVDFHDGGRGWETGYAVFQFEREAPALMFALTFGAA